MSIQYYSDPLDNTNYGLYIRELPQRSATYNWDFRTTYSRTWEAICPEIPGGGGEHYGPVVVGLTFRQLGIYPGALYLLPYSGEQDPVARCSEVSIQQSGDSDKPQVYTVTANYEVGTFGSVDNPLSAPPTFSWGSTDMEVPLFSDLDPMDPKPILNSAGDLFDDPVMTPYSRSTLTVRINQASYSEAYAAALRNKVNGGPWNGYPANTVLVKAITAEKVDTPSLPKGYYWAVTYVFEFDTVLTYKCQRIDAGWQYLDGGTRKRIFDSEFNEPAEIPLLDGSGGKLGVNDPPVILEFQQYEQINFSAEFPFTLPT